MTALTYHFNIKRRLLLVKKFFKKIIPIGALFIVGLDCYAINLEQQKYKDFLLAEKALIEKDEQLFSRLSAKLIDYPLHFYLQYQWLVNNLGETQKIQDFLTQDNSSLYSRQLRQKWLKYLYANQQWASYAENYRAVNKVALKCRYQWARYQVGEKNKALEATKAIWLTGTSLPKDCDELLTKFKESPFLTQKLIWQRFRLAIYANKPTLAGFLQRRIVGAIAQADARAWRRLLKNVDLISESTFLKNISKLEQANMLVYATRELISSNLNAAIKVWSQQKNKLVITAKQVQEIEGAIALQLAFIKSEKAYTYFKKLNHKDQQLRAWEVRAALITGNWTSVQDALSQLPDDEIKTDRWQYWKAKAYLHTGQFKKARVIFSRLAKERSYYGFLSADYVLKTYILSNKPSVVNEKAIESLLRTTHFRVINEFRGLQRTYKAKQYWKEVMGGLSELELVVAAKIAERWKWHKQAILAMAKAKQWNDLTLRFPIDFVETIEKTSRKKGLDPAFIYGLIRRESMFDEGIRSPSGALGLMQIMPSTGRQIAREINYPWKSNADLLLAPTSIKFGTYYYKQMLKQFSGNFAVATAAYNAGPSGVKRWLKFDRNYSTDLWVETIPYKETREYVESVLTYALIYQRGLGGKKNLMIDFMPEIQAEKY